MDNTRERNPLERKEPENSSAGPLIEVVLELGTMVVKKIQYIPR